MPPPVAELPLKVLLVIVSVAAADAEFRPLSMPPPLEAELSLMVLLVIVSVA